MDEKLATLKELRNLQDDLWNSWYEWYRKLAWEVESRNVQTRMNMTAKERALKSPESTEDVPRNKQIVRFKNDGTSMSIDKAGTMEIPEALAQEARKYKSADEFIKYKITPPKEKVYLYRWMSQKFDPKFDLWKTDAPIWYSTWTDNLKLAEQYAGENWFVYKIELPKSKLWKEIIDKDWERTLFFNNEKKAWLNNVSWDEYLIYNYHDDYSPNLIKQTQTESQLKQIYKQANKKK